MKIKYLIFTFFALFISVLNVNASSIDYNLNIDKDLNFSESIKYTMTKKEINVKGYNFLKSVVNDDIYFNDDDKVKYDKSIENTSDGYIVTLKHDYTSLFLEDSRILKECFTNIDYDYSNSGISFTGNSPFYCPNRADIITIKITTDLNVTSNNADTVSGNTYIWNEINEDFSLNFSVEPSKIESKPMDDVSSDEEKTETSQENETNKNENSESKGISPIVFVVFGSLFVLGIIIALIYLKIKSEKMNSI